jgi:outer membrane protein OmpA-like peptidoglycan-associated protein
MEKFVNKIITTFTNRHLLSLVLFLGTFAGYSQDLQDGLDLVQQHKYEDAAKIFQKAVSKQKDMLVAKYGFAKLFFDTAYPKYNYTKAYKNSSYVLKRWQRTPEQEKSKIQKKYGLTYDDFFSIDSLIQLTAYNDLKNDPTPEKHENFTKNFVNAGVYKWKLDSEAKIEIKKLREYSSLEAYDLFIAKFKDSPEADTVRQWKNKFYFNKLRVYTQDGDPGSVARFERDFPRANLPDSIIRPEIVFCEMANSLQLDKGYNEMLVSSYEAYIVKAGKRKQIAFNVLQRLLTPSISVKNWKKSLEILNKFAGYFPVDDARIKSLKEILEAPKLDVEIKKIEGDSINTSSNEYIPVISGDESKLFFCAYSRSDGMGLEDIFVAEKKKGVWQKPKPLKELNTIDGYEAPLSVSSDGSILIFFRNRQLFYSTLGEKGWGIPKKIGETINSQYWQGEAQISSDGNVLLFVSDRPGGQGLYHSANENYAGGSFGNVDMYAAFRVGDDWSEPVNLGPTLNTPFCERGLFLHPDMKTLYFSSDGLGGLGGLDIFKTTRLNDSTWTDWSEPINLGKDINTVFDDWGYKISTSGERAYFAAREVLNYDLYIMNMPQKLRPQKIATINGRIVNSAGTPLAATIRWEDLVTGKLIGKAETDPKDGKFFLVVPLGRHYGCFVEKENYFPSSVAFDLRTQKESVDYSQEIVLESIQEMNDGRPIRMNNLFFDTDAFALKSESYPELNRIAKLLLAHGGITVEIGGHTDNTGDSAHNDKLSLDRSNAVKVYLVSRGLKDSQLVVKGYGSSVPLVANTNSANRAQNRRVELKVVK